MVIDNTQGLFLFPSLTMQFKSSTSKIKAKSQSVLTGETLTKQPMTTKTTTTFADQPSKWNATGTITPKDIYRDSEFAGVLLNVKEH